MVLEIFKKRCTTCLRDLLVVPNFPIRLSPFDSESPFKDTCFDCTPFDKRMGDRERWARPLFRPPTLEEYPDEGLHPRTNYFQLHSGMTKRFREFAEESQRRQCRICGLTAKDVDKFKQRRDIDFCPRCLASLPASMRGTAKATRFDYSPLYPYRGLFRRIGPHTCPAPTANVDILYNAFQEFLDYTDGSHPEYAEYTEFGQMMRRLFEGTLHARGYNRAIIAGHYMYKNRLSTIDNLETLLNQIDPKRSRSYGKENRRRMFQYLLGDSFPHHARSYEFIRIALANRAHWADVFDLIRYDDGRPSISVIPISERLAILLSPRVLPIEALQYINATLSVLILLNIPSTRSFYSNYRIDRLLARIGSITNYYETKETFYPANALKQIEKKEVGLLEALTHSCAGSADSYTFEHAAADLGRALLRNDDEWWTMLEIGEIYVRTEILKSKQDPRKDTGALKDMWRRVVVKLWDIAYSTITPKKLQAANFSFPRQPKLDNDLLSYGKELLRDETKAKEQLYDQLKTQGHLDPSAGQTPLLERGPHAPIADPGP